MNIIGFDFDGTIHDNHDRVISLMKEIADKYSIQHHFNRDYIRNQSFKRFLFYDIGLKGIAQKKSNLYRFLPRTKKYTADIRQQILQEPIVEGMEELIQRLAEHYTLGIVSTNKLANIDTVLREKNLYDYFDFVEEVPLFSSKKKVLQKIEKQFKPKKKLYIGDEIRDIKHTKKADWPCVAVSWGYNSRSALEKMQPAFLVNSPKELEEKIEHYFLQ